MGCWGERLLRKDQEEKTRKQVRDPQSQELDPGGRGSVGRPGGRGYLESGDGDP